MPMSRPPSRLTVLQEWTVAAYLLLEHAREELSPAEWRCLVWILTDHIGKEAALLVVAEALEATEEESAA